MSTSLTSNDFLNDLLTYFQTQCLSGLNSLLPEAIFLVWTLGIILIVMRLITQGNIFGSGSWQSYIITVLKIGVFIFLISNWEDISINIILKSFEVAGQTASNSFSAIHPSDILMVGFTLTKAVLAGIWKTVLTGTLLLVAFKLLLCLVIIVAFAYMAIMFLMVTIEFYLTASLSVILLPFGMISYLKFLFDNVVSAMFSFGVKYMTMIFILGLGTNIFASYTAFDPETPPQDLIKAAVGIVVWCVMCLQIPGLVSGMIHGAPSNDSGTGMITNAATAAGGAAVSGGRTVGRSVWNNTSTLRQKGLEMTKRGGRTAMNKAKVGGRVAMDKAKNYTAQSLSNMRNRFMGS